VLRPPGAQFAVDAAQPAVMRIDTRSLYDAIGVPCTPAEAEGRDAPVAGGGGGGGQVAAA
jgi:hypothetical protein